MKISIFLLLFFFAFQSLIAQDQSNSVFCTSSITLNPATTGTFGNSNLRVHSSFNWNNYYGNYHENIMSISVDKTLLKGKLGVGGDVSYEFGDDISKNKGAMLSAAYNTEFLNDNFKVSLGMQGGLIQNSIDWDHINLMEPDDPIFGNIKNHVLYPDFNLGMLVFRDTDKTKIKHWIGLTMSHLFRPDVSLFPEYSSPLPRKLTIYTGANVPANDHIVITPMLLFTNQRKLNIIDLGGSARYNTGSFSLSAGGLYKMYWSGNAEQHRQSLLAEIGYAGLELRLELLVLTDRAINQSFFSNGTVGLSWNLNEGKN